jgi:hypothetical protein
MPTALTNGVAFSPRLRSNTKAEPFFSRKRMARRLEALRGERDAHIQDWRDITDYIRPQRGRYLYDKQEQSKRATKVINSAPAIASRTLRSGLLAGVSSPSYPWFRLRFAGADPQLNDWGPAKIYLEAREKVLYSVLARSNFYNVMQVAYGDAGDFGNMAVVMDASPRSVLTCHVCTPGTYFLGQDSEGDIDTLYREFPMTTAQLIKDFGYEAVSQTVREQWDRSTYDTPHRVIEVREFNAEQDPSQFGWRGMPFICCSFLADSAHADPDRGPRDDEGNKVLEIKGYEVWPVPNLRWDLDSGNIYGSGPGLMALGDARALQSIERRKGQGIDKMVIPPLQGPPQLKSSSVTHVPGGMTYVDPHSSGAGAPIRELYAINPQAIVAISAEIAIHENRIDQAYFKDLFLLLATTDRREITAREVEEKHEEKLLALGPMLQRTHRDALDNAIRRADYICFRAGLYPPPPPELEGSALEVEYVSTLAHAQRSVNVSSIERTFMFASTIASQGFPAALHKLDPMAAIDEYAETTGVPARVIIPTRKASESMAAEQEQAQAAQALEAAPGVASAARDLSETDTSRPSPLREIIRAGQNL